MYLCNLCNGIVIASGKFLYLAQLRSLYLHVSPGFPASVRQSPSSRTAAVTCVDIGPAARVDRLVSRAVLSRADPSRVGPFRAESSQAGRSRADPSGAERSRVELS